MTSLTSPYYKCEVLTCFKKTTIFLVPKNTHAACLYDYHLVALTSKIIKCFERLVMALINYHHNSKPKQLVTDFRKQDEGHAPVYINGAEVEMVECVKFLGVMITNNLSLSTCVDATVKKRSRCDLLYIGETKQRLGDHFAKHLRLVRNKQLHLSVTNHFNSPSHSLDDMSILGFLQCHNDATRRLQEQQLIFCLGTLQPNGINVDFT
eukprot:g36236.t1